MSSLRKTGREWQESEVAVGQESEVAGLDEGQGAP